MNAQVFSELLTDISDEYIVSAANPHSKPIRWYQISAIAACIVLLVSAAVYPKLRTRTPEITEPLYPVTATTVMKEIQTTTYAAQTTALTTEFAAFTNTQTETSSFSVIVTESATVIQTEIDVSTEPLQNDETNTVNQQNTETALATVTEPSVVTTVLVESQEPVTLQSAGTTQTVPADVPERVTVPIWKGVIEYPESASDPNALPYISCRFSSFEPSTINPEPDNSICMEYGIPQEYDLTDHQCLLIHIESDYASTAVMGGELTKDGLVLKIACLNPKARTNNVLHFAAAIPSYLPIEPESCRAEYLIYDAEDEFPEIENPMIEMIE